MNHKSQAVLATDKLDSPDSGLYSEAGVGFETPSYGQNQIDENSEES